jgi:hypothetical protein
MAGKQEAVVDEDAGEDAEEIVVLMVSRVWREGRVFWVEFSYEEAKREEMVVVMQ